MYYFNDSLTKALTDVYSFLDFELNKFTNIPRMSFLIFKITTKQETEFYWKDANNRRKFFVDFAKKNHFDPLVASNWYTVLGTDIVAIKV